MIVIYYTNIFSIYKPLILDIFYYLLPPFIVLVFPVIALKGIEVEYGINY